MSVPKCHVCDHQFELGQAGWVEDWTVVTPDGTRIEQRYLCDECEAAK